MDEMKISLSTKLMRGLIAKLLKKVIRDKTGYSIDIQLNQIAISHVENGKIGIRVDMNAEIDEKEFLKITQGEMPFCIY